MKILIIGSEGFIGSNLASYFSAINEVTVYKCDIIEAPISDVNYVLYNGSNLKEIISSEKFDICINAAGAANVSNSIKNPSLDYELNVTLVFNILEAIRTTNNTCKFIQFSSAAVYGNPQKLPIIESETVKPLTPYGYHKWQSELLCKEYYEIYKIPSIILRVFSVYGPGLQKQLFWDLYNKTKLNSNINIYGTGNESRDFIYIDDLINCVHQIIKKGLFNAEIYNVANGEEIFIKNAVEYFLSYLNRSHDKIFTGEEREGDPLNWKADITKLKRIGYIQSINFENGIEKYCKWLKELK